MSPETPAGIPMNPLHYQVALNEANVQIQLISSRAQALAVELYDARMQIDLLRNDLENEKVKNAGPQASNEKANSKEE